MKKITVVLAAVICAVSWCTVVSGAVITGYEHRWTAGLESWQIADYVGGGGSPYGSIAQGSNLGQPALEITGSSTTNFSPRTDKIFTTDGPLATNTSFSGLGASSIWLNFYADATPGGPGPAAPGALTLYFYSSSSGGVTWYYDISSISAGWSMYSANVGTTKGSWYSSGGDTQAEWDNALADVDEIGLLLTYQQGYGDEEYGLDDFYLDDAGSNFLIPEPATFMVLGFTFLSMGVTFRKRYTKLLRDLLGLR